MTAGSIPAEEEPEAATPDPEADGFPAAAGAGPSAPEVAELHPASAPPPAETAQQRKRRLHRERLAARLGTSLAAPEDAGEPEALAREAPVPVAPAPPPAAARERPAGDEAHPTPAAADAAEVPNAEHQALWFVLARRRPRSVALVAVERDLPVGALAVSLAEVGRRLSDQPVTAVVADPCDYGFVTRTTSLLAATGGLSTPRPGASPLEVIVAIPPVTAEPLGLAVAQAVDAVVLCFGLGRTTIDAARETIDLVGRERIVGCVAFGEG